MIKELYLVRDAEKMIFGSNWCGPVVSFESHKKTLVAKYPKEPDSDGQDVEIYCTSAPARFYDMKVLGGCNSIGDEKKRYNFGTGSGCEMAEVLVVMAKHIQNGMLTLGVDHE